MNNYERNVSKTMYAVTAPYADGEDKWKTSDLKN